MVRAAVFWTCWLLITLFCARWELLRLIDAAESEVGVFQWFVNWDPETTLPLIVLLLLPVFRVMKLRSTGSVTRRNNAQPSADSASDAMVAVSTPCVMSRTQCLAGMALVFVSSLTASGWIGFQPIGVRQRFEERQVRFCNLPPAYHDEFSYQLQADTFIAGRLAWPPMTIHPELFHQFHVLNQPTTASRYFPWTGLWIAPFRMMGHSIFGHWLAGGIASVFFFLSLAQILPYRWALLGGLLIACSPGIAVFSNLLLAHHPTMMALAIFLWSFLRLFHTGRTRFAAVAGAALTLAMLGRPMTAAGFALPFGIWLGAKLFQGSGRRRFRSVTGVVASFAVPLALGFLLLAVSNNATTGSWTTSPYQLYTDTWTPRHCYGFNNAVMDGKASTSSGIPSLQAYDNWAQNLTPTRAIQNVETRLLGSLQWSLSIVPLVLFIVIAALMQLVNLWSGRSDTRVLLLLGAVLSLHLVHVPYWYDGIMGWHYVFETAPLLLMICAIGVAESVDYLSAQMSPFRAGIWATSLIIVGWLPGWVNQEAGWGRAKVVQAVNQLAYSRKRLQQFQWQVESAEIRKPALILVDENGADPQLSYIINPPDFQSEALVCRLPETAEQLHDLRQKFPGRQCYRFDPETFTLARLD
ncbi:MAG: glycosyltransferase family 39 protein [Planctomycetaceae bacterium]|nr:glycosyltransferase family 39 protein [Planctomycetaceae bacterium]